MSDKKEFYNDYWRKAFLSEDNTDKSVFERCLEDLSKIGHFFDNNIKIKYKLPNVKANKGDVLLDPFIAASKKLEYGEKIDIYCGEILLNIALNKYNSKTKNNYSVHINNIYDNKSSTQSRGASLLFLAMEVNAAFKKLITDAPGYEPYAGARVKYYHNEKLSQELQDKFLTEQESKVDKFTSFIRELDSFRSLPLDYNKSQDEVNEVLDTADKTSTPKERLDLAKKIAAKYLDESSELDSKISSLFNQGNGEEESEEESEESDEQLKTAKKFFTNKGLFKPSQKNNEEGETSPSAANKGSLKELMKEMYSEPKVILREVSDKDTKNYKEYYHKEKQSVWVITDAVRESLEILNLKTPVWDEYALRRGELDEGALHKLVDNSADNIFYIEETLPKNYIQLGFLIDESASMEALGNKELTRIQIARKLTVAFLEATIGNPGIDFSVFGHAGPMPNCTVYRYISPETSEENYPKVLDISGKLHNYDGYAIEKTGELLLNDHRKDYKKRLLFAISDGEPSVANYRGQKALDHTRGVVNKLRSLGLDTYMIGVADHSTDYSDYMYGKENYIILPDGQFNLNLTAKVISSFIENICKNI